MDLTEVRESIAPCRAAMLLIVWVCGTLARLLSLLKLCSSSNGSSSILQHSNSLKPIKGTFVRARARAGGARQRKIDDAARESERASEKEHDKQDFPTSFCVGLLSRRQTNERTSKQASDRPKEQANSNEWETRLNEASEKKERDGHVLVSQSVSH